MLFPKHAHVHNQNNLKHSQLFLSKIGNNDNNERENLQEISLYRHAYDYNSCIKTLLHTLSLSSQLS